MSSTRYLQRSYLNLLLTRKDAVSSELGETGEVGERGYQMRGVQSGGRTAVAARTTTLETLTRVQGSMLVSTNDQRGPASLQM